MWFMHQQPMNDAKILNYSSCHGTDKAIVMQMNAGFMCHTPCWVSQQAQLQQYCVGREGREEQSKALQCSVALCHWGKWSIGQRHLWTFTALGVFKSDCLTGAHTTQRGVQNQMLCTSSAGAPSTTPSVTCNGEPKAIPARNAPTQGHGLQTLHCSTQPIRVATASVCSPSLRKEIHFISANLAV